jgi:hypothetical protein
MITLKFTSPSILKYKSIERSGGVSLESHRHRWLVGFLILVLTWLFFLLLIYCLYSKIFVLNLDFHCFIYIYLPLKNLFGFNISLVRPIQILTYKRKLCIEKYMLKSVPLILFIYLLIRTTY